MPASRDTGNEKQKKNGTELKRVVFPYRMSAPSSVPEG